MKRENNGSSVCPPYTQFAQFQYSFEFVFMITHFSRKNNYIIVLSMRKDKGDSKYKYLAMSDKAQKLSSLLCDGRFHSSSLWEK